MSSVEISNEEKERIYIGARTPVNDEQFYFATFGILFIFVSSWALSSNFKPTDTVVVLLCFGIILIILTLIRYLQRYSIIKDNLVGRLGTKEIYTNNVPLQEMHGFEKFLGYFRLVIYWLFDVRIKPWKEFQQLKDQTNVKPANWQKLKEMIEMDEWVNQKGYVLFATMGSIAVLGTILRLHGTRGLSNTSGIVLVVLYEIVFTLYCSWQLLFKQQHDAVQECINTLPKKDKSPQQSSTSFYNPTYIQSSSSFFNHRLK